MSFKIICKNFELDNLKQEYYNNNSNNNDNK